MNYPPQPGQYGGSEGWGQQSGPWGSDPHGSQPRAGGPWGGHPQYPQGQYPQQGGPYGQHPQTGGQPAPGGATDFWRYVVPGSGGPGTPPKKPRTGLVLSLVFGGVLLLGAGVLLVVLLVPSDEDIAVGDCVSLASVRGGHTEPADCGTADSDYEVVDVNEGENPNSCPDFWNNTDDGSTYCLALDVEVGDCLTEFQSSEELLPLKKDCASPDPVDRVSDVTETTDVALCESSDGYYVFARPALTVCFNTPEGV